jgi:prevent-host-death family protein
LGNLRKPRNVLASPNAIGGGLRLEEQKASLMSKLFLRAFCSPRKKIRKVTMAVQIKSSEAQQNFGRIVDKALMEGDVIIERYGEPRVVIIGYQRYEKLLEAERSLAGLYITQPDVSSEARKKGQILAEKVRQEYKTTPDESLEEGMSSLRGRS